MPKVIPGSDSVKMLKKMLSAETQDAQAMFDIVVLISNLESGSADFNEPKRPAITRFSPEEASTLKRAIKELKNSEKLSTAQSDKLANIERNYGSLIDQLASKVTPAILEPRIDTKRKAGSAWSIIKRLQRRSPYRTADKSTDNQKTSDLSASTDDSHDKKKRFL